MKLILFGYRGSGKSTCGKIAAQLLDRRFVDTDDGIVLAYNGMSIKLIFEIHGEPHFRVTEARVCAEALNAKVDTVIALGGGAIIQEAVFNNFQQAAKEAKAVRVYLRCSVEELTRRIQGDQTTAANRPHLSKLGGGLQEVRNILKKRDPIYSAAADHIVDVDQLSPAEVAEKLVKLIREVEA